MTLNEKNIANTGKNRTSGGTIFSLFILLSCTLFFSGACTFSTGKNSNAQSESHQQFSLISHSDDRNSLGSGTISYSSSSATSSKPAASSELSPSSKPAPSPTQKPVIKPTSTTVPTLVPGNYTPKINPDTGYDEALTGRNLFLTYDDGPSSNNTPIVLATLKKYHVKATFFVCGPDTPERRALIKQEFEQGHAIGIHCYSHYLNKLYASESAFFADFNKIETMVKAVTGIQPVLYRFPGGTNNGFISKSLSDLIIRKLKEKGYEYYDWNVSSQDSANPTVQKIANNVITQCRNRVNAKNPSLILIHDSGSRTNSAAATEIFLKELTRAGYYFASLDKTVPPVHFRK